MTSHVLSRCLSCDIIGCGSMCFDVMCCDSRITWFLRGFALLRVGSTCPADINRSWAGYVLYVFEIRVSICRRDGYGSVDGLMQ